MKVFFRFFRDYPRESILAPLFKLLEACFDLFVPIVIAQIIDNGMSGDRGDSYIWWRAGILVLLAIVGLICAVTAQYFSAKAAVGTATRIRHDLFAHMQNFTYAQTDRVGTSTMITRMTSDINQIQSGVNMTLRLTLRSPIIVFGAMIMAFTINAKLALIFVAAIPLLALVVFGVMLGGIPLYRRVQSKLDRVTSATRSNLGGVRVIRAFRKEEEEIRNFDRIDREQTDLQNKAGLLSSLMNPVTYVLVNLAVVLIIRRSRTPVDTGVLTQGQVVALVNYMGQILVELVKLANAIFMITKAVACGNRVEAVLEMPAGMEIHPAEPQHDDGRTWAVEFDRVELTYPGGGAPSLSEIDLRVAPGETVGIIGGTGSGKSSLISLIPRYYEATHGTVRVHGQDVRAQDPTALRAHIGIVPQKAELFRGTIRSNLLWGTPDGQADDETLWAALETAQAADFVRIREGGLDAPVEQKGRNFSGGQRQRLTIARALVGHPDILILDDSASALDLATDAALRRALRELPGHPTVFIISQRTSSIHACDQILVLEDGRPAGVGTHEQLLQDCPLYREIHGSQFKGGEAR